MIGLTDKSDTQELVVKQDEATAVKYTVKEETIDLDLIRRERDNLQAELDQPEPSDEELIAIAKTTHPYYAINRQAIQEKIDEINSLLEQ